MSDTTIVEVGELQRLQRIAERAERVTRENDRMLLAFQQWQELKRKTKAAKDLYDEYLGRTSDLILGKPVEESPELPFEGDTGRKVSAGADESEGNDISEFLKGIDITSTQQQALADAGILSEEALRKLVAGEHPDYPKWPSDFNGVGPKGAKMIQDYLRKLDESDRAATATSARVRVKIFSELAPELKPDAEVEGTLQDDGTLLYSPADGSDAVVLNPDEFEVLIGTHSS